MLFWNISKIAILLWYQLFEVRINQKISFLSHPDDSQLVELEFLSGSSSAFLEWPYSKPLIALIVKPTIAHGLLARHGFMMNTRSLKALL